MALSKFFKSPTWVEWQKTLIPALVTAFEFISSTIKSAGEMIVKGVTAFSTLFTTGFFDKEGKFIGIDASFTLLKDAFLGVGTFIVGLGLLLSPVKLGKVAINLALSGLKLAFTGALGLTQFLGKMAGKILSLAATGAKGAGQLILNSIKAVGGALTALRTFMMASLLPAITGMLAGFAPLLVPLLIVVGVIAAVALVIASIKNAFDDFKATLEETGSIFEALKVGFASLVANVLGIIPNLIIDFVAWIFKKLGWTEWAAKLKEIDVVSFIKNGLLNIFTKLGEWIGLIYDDYIKPLLAPLLKFFDPVISLIKTVFNFLLDAIQPVVDIITKIGAKVVDFVKGLIPKLPSWLGGGDDTEEKVIVPEIIKLEEDSVTLAKVQEERIKGNIADTSNMVSEYAGVSDAIKRQKEDSSTTVISAPVSNTTNMSSSTNISKTIVEPDAYFLRQSGWAI
jgi:Flp pilus assembly pilin Flp